MNWIIGAAILNTIWTLWCALRLPQRVATRFGVGGQPEGWMSKKGFALFAILFPLLMAAFLVYIGGIVPPEEGLAPAMEKMAAGFILFFSFISWCLVRSNRNTPPRMDYLSLFIGIVVLMVVVVSSLSGLPPKKEKGKQASIILEPMAQELRLT